MRRERRFRGGVAATVLLASLGAMTGSGVLLLAAAIPLGFVVIGALGVVSVPKLSVIRTIEPSPVPPDRPVTVTLEVTNDGERAIADCRVLDGVPDELAVVAGSPRVGGTLQPGESLSMRYRVGTHRGQYRFADPQVRVRGFLGGSVATATVDSDGDTVLDCRLTAGAPPLDAIGYKPAGQEAADQPGRGVVFHSTREHQPQDPADHIDWRHYAKRGTLASVNYERRIAMEVVLVVDAREVNRVVPGPGRATAVELAAYAATRATADLLGRGNEVGLAIIGLDGPGPAGVHWIPPGSGRSHQSRLIEGLQRAADADEADRWSPAAQRRAIVQLRPPRSQLVLFGPFLDDEAVTTVEYWRGANVPVVAFSPDVIPENTVSGQFEQVRRRTRLATAQRIGTRTVDWRRGSPLPTALNHAFAIEARTGGDTSTSAQARGGGD